MNKRFDVNRVVKVAAASSCPQLLCGQGLNSRYRHNIESPQGCETAVTSEIHTARMAVLSKYLRNIYFLIFTLTDVPRGR